MEKRLQKSPNEVWNILKELQGKAGEEACNVVVEGHEVQGEEAANIFNDYYIEKVRRTKEKLGEEAAHPMKSTEKRADVLALKKDSLDFTKVTEEDVIRAIKSMKASKATDTNGISPFILKLAAPVMATPLAFVISGSLSQAKVPTCWKKAVIHPLHQKKSKKDIANYRPVSILSTPSKVLESVVHHQLSKQVERLDIIPGSQHGFRKDRSTITAVASLEHDLKLAKKAKKTAGALFLDLSAAFDTIDGNILSKKLEVYGATSRVTRWIKSYLSERQQKVIYQQGSSDLKMNSYGAPQGSVLSPFLFSVLVSDMEESLDELGVRLISYADDTTVYAVGDSTEEVTELLSKAAEKLLGFMHQSGLAVNTEKTNLVIFGQGGATQVKVGEAIIEESSAEKLVGVWLTKDLSWEKHFREQEHALLVRIGILRRLSWHLPRKTVLRCISPVFTSKLTYSLELMADPLKHLSQDQPKCSFIVRLQKLLNEAVRAALGLKRSDKISEEELMKRSGQVKVAVLAERALVNQAWNALASKERRLVSEVAKRVEWGQNTRVTRQSEGNFIPPQSLQNTLVAKACKVGNILPEDIRNEQSKTSVKTKIRSLFCNISNLI